MVFEILVPTYITNYQDNTEFLFIIFSYSYDELNAWAVDKCSPLVREITFENAEELTEEGLPFLILFHAPEDNESIKQYSDIVLKELMEDKRKFTIPIVLSPIKWIEIISEGAFSFSFAYVLIDS